MLFNKGKYHVLFKNLVQLLTDFVPVFIVSILTFDLAVSIIIPNKSFCLKYLFTIKSVFKKRFKHSHFEIYSINSM